MPQGMTKRQHRRWCDKHAALDTKAIDEAWEAKGKVEPDPVLGLETLDEAPVDPPKVMRTFVVKSEASKSE